MKFQAVNIFNCALSFVEDPTFEEERPLSLNKEEGTLGLFVMCFYNSINTRVSTRFEAPKLI